MRKKCEGCADYLLLQGPAWGHCLWKGIDVNGTQTACGEFAQAFPVYYNLDATVKGERKRLLEKAPLHIFLAG